MKKKTNDCQTILFLPLIILIFLFCACVRHESVILPAVSDYELAPIQEMNHLRVGVSIGPYGEMFLKGIQPSLEELGYTAELVHFDDFVSPNFALARNHIDLNIFQHYAYLNRFKFEHDLALSAITEIPTISMGVFSNRFRSISNLTRGITVSIPSDPSNLARSLVILEAAGILTLNPYIEKPKATLADIVSNPLNIRLIPIQAHHLVESLKTYDVSVINGNYALSGGLHPSQALFNEILSSNYLLIVAVRTEDLSKRFARDIIDVVHSPAFRDIITDPAGMFTDFQKPCSFYDIPFENWRNRF